MKHLDDIGYIILIAITYPYFKIVDIIDTISNKNKYRDYNGDSEADYQISRRWKI